MSHYQKLQNMYYSGPINQATYPDVVMDITEGHAEISLEVKPKYFHAGQSMHGSVYFKMLDDAAYFAVNSVVKDCFVYTVSFNIQILRPVKAGKIKAVGELKFSSKNLWVADAVLYDAKGREVARGSGNFMKSSLLLDESIGYQL